MHKFKQVLNQLVVHLTNLQIPYPYTISLFSASPFLSISTLPLSPRLALSHDNVHVSVKMDMKFSHIVLFAGLPYSPSLAPSLSLALSPHLVP